MKRLCRNGPCVILGINVRVQTKRPMKSSTMATQYIAMEGYIIRSRNADRGFARLTDSTDDPRRLLLVRGEDDEDQKKQQQII